MSSCKTTGSQFVYCIFFVEFECELSREGRSLFCRAHTCRVCAVLVSVDASDSMEGVKATKVREGA